MGGCRCSYKNCTNTTKSRDNLHFFHYPVKHTERCRQWIKNAQKSQFYDLDEDQLRNKVICETHFEDCFFPNFQRKRLLQGAIPTLDGACERKPSRVERSVKIPDVEVHPASADGTIFVLETNMQHQFQSEKVESYIYTKNGLIKKSNLAVDDCVQTAYSGSEVEDSEETPAKRREVIKPVNLTVEKQDDFGFRSDYKPAPTPKLGQAKVSVYKKDKETPQKSAPVDIQEAREETRNVDELFSKIEGNQYIKKIKQHSKDIAILKRILKSRRLYRKPSTSAILNCLKRYLPASLFSVVSMNFNSKCDLSAEDLDFFKTIYSTSPQTYQVLLQKYNWKLPNPDLLTNKNNGHLFCDSN